MKLCISAQGKSLDATVDPRFGRCAYFVFVETEGMTTESIENPFASAPGAAGTRSAQLLADRNVRCLLTGRCGPNAQQALAAAGIEVVTECQGTVAQAIAAFQSGH